MLPWWPDVTIVQSDVTIVVPWQLSISGCIYDYLFCYWPLVCILFEVLRIKPIKNIHVFNVKYVQKQYRFYDTLTNWCYLATIDIQYIACVVFCSEWELSVICWHPWSCCVCRCGRTKCAASMTYASPPHYKCSRHHTSMLRWTHSKR